MVTVPFSLLKFEKEEGNAALSASCCNVCERQTRLRRALVSRLSQACPGLQDAGLAGQQGYFNGKYWQSLDNSRSGCF